MERGPVALFGAIIAVGLGPAMWLGAQFGNSTDLPSSPPAVRSEHNPQNQDKGGAAGSAPEDPTVVLETKPRTDKGLDVSRSHPSASPTSTATVKTDPPAGAGQATPTDDTTTPATEPADPPPGDGNGGGDGSGNGGGDGSGDGPVPPSPPTDSGSGSGGDTQQPAV